VKLSVDTAALRQAGAHTMAAGHVLSSTVGGGKALATSAGSLQGLASGAALTTAARRWEQQVERLAALVRSDGIRIMQAAEAYDTSDDNSASGFQQMLDSLNKTGDVDWSKVLVR
jgi:Protein of unknown function (DUF2580).